MNKGAKASKFALYRHKFDALRSQNNDALKQPGIYMIWNKVNDHVYVGQSKELIARKRDHFKSLANNKHCNPYLQNAYNKYGCANFVFIVVEYCKFQDLDDKEQYWIERLKPEYNICRNVFEWSYPDKKITDGMPEVMTYTGEDEFPRPLWHYWVYGAGVNSR